MKQNAFLVSTAMYMYRHVCICVVDYKKKRNVNYLDLYSLFIDLFLQKSKKKHHRTVSCTISISTCIHCYAIPYAGLMYKYVTV